MEYESKLVPILREGIDVIKMVLFQKLKNRLAEKYTGQESSQINMLAGAIINEIFGTPNTQEPFATFLTQHQSRIQQELSEIATEFPEMRLPLTDALRVQFLCDHQEGTGSSSILSRAKELDILLTERDAPLPGQFMGLVRKLGGSFELLTPLQPSS